MMERISQWCLAKPKAYEDRPVGEYPVCYRVNGRIFAQVYMDKITLKCTVFQGEMLRQAYPEVVVRGYHCPPVQQPYWNTVDLTRFPLEELPYLIDLAYEAVLSGFSRKVRADILADQ